jgi:hypothetical protein
VLAEIFGTEWVLEYVCPSRLSTFLLNNASPGANVEFATHVIRVVQLSEMLINSQWIPGYEECLRQLKTADMIESTYAELDIARALIVHKIKFRFNKRLQRKGEDFDLLISFDNGIEACADTKCKLETTPYSDNTVMNALEHARGQNLPNDRPGIIFMKIPQTWVPDDTGHQRLVRCTNRFFGTTKRIVSVKYYTSFIHKENDTFRETMAWYEMTNSRNRFDKGADWRLFATHSQVATGWNGMPPHWRRLFAGSVL